ncbi:MAG: hypothetical protein P8X65_01550 [Syntrophobacterales bacterium]|jgi:hypothetical protein
MKIRYWLILGLALLLIVPLVLSFPGTSQAQQNKSSVSQGPGMQGYGRGYYGNNDNSSRNSYGTPGYGYSMGPRNYGNRGPRSWNRGNGNTWCPWNGGYAGSYRNSRGGHCW